MASPAPNEIWVAGSSNAQLELHHFVNGTWTQSTIPGVTGGEIEGSASDDVWLEADTSFQHYDGSSWTEVAVPEIPGALMTFAGVMADVPGPDFYASFMYSLEDTRPSPSTEWELVYARYNGSAWTLLGAPADDNRSMDGADQLEFVDGTLVSMTFGYHHGLKYVISYADGQWSEPVLVSGTATDRALIEDWVVDSPTDIWLYGSEVDENGRSSWCGHFNGQGLDHTPCAAGEGTGIWAATGLPDGRHMVGSGTYGIGRFDLLDQPGQQTQIENIDISSVVELVAEPETGAVWASTSQAGVPGFLILRYGDAADTSAYALTASGPSTVKQGDLATITGTIDPVSSVATERTVALEVKTGTTWTPVTTTEAAADGTYRFDAQLSTAGTSTYRVTKEASGELTAGVSNTVAITALEPFQLTAKAPTQVSVGSKLVITGKVTPAPNPAAADEGGIELQAKSGSTWKTVITDRTAEDGTYRFVIVPGRAGTTTYRVFKPAAGVLDAASSPTVKVKVKAKSTGTVS